MASSHRVSRRINPLDNLELYNLRPTRRLITTCIEIAITI